jgi:hypothetical protein
MAMQVQVFGERAARKPVGVVQVMAVAPHDGAWVFIAAPCAGRRVGQ